MPNKEADTIININGVLSIYITYSIYMQGGLSIFDDVV